MLTHFPLRSTGFDGTLSWKDQGAVAILLTSNYLKV